MALVGTGAISWKSPPRDLPALGGRPIWMSAWFRNSGFLSWQSPGCFQGPAANCWAGPYQNASGANALGDLNDAGAGPALNGSSYTLVWSHVLALFVGASERYLWYNGVKVVSDTTTLTGPQTLTTLSIGGVPGAISSSPTAFAEVTFGTGLLSAGQIAALAAGRNPLAVAPNRLLGYFPLRGSLEDLGSRRAGLVPTGAPTTIWTDHPRVELPPRRRLFFPTSFTPPPTSRRPLIFFIS